MPPFLGFAAMLLLAGSAFLPRHAPRPYGQLEPAVREAADDWRSKHPTQPIRVLDPRITASIERLKRDSPTFHAAWTRIVDDRLPLLMGTQNQLQWLLTFHDHLDLGWDGLIYMYPLRSRHHRVDHAAVAVRMGYHQGLAEAADTSAETRDFDLLIAHEIYGHLVPALDGGNPMATCWDPGHAPKTSQESNCMSERVATIRAEVEEARGIRR